MARGSDSMDRSGAGNGSSLTSEDFRGSAWLEPLPLPGGDAGIRNPGRVAVAYLYKLFGEIPALPFLSKLDDAEVKTVRVQVERGINLAMTSSAGRLFDVVAAMAGGPVRATYEAQAAIEMEMVSQETIGILSLRSPPRSKNDDMGKCNGITGMDDLL